MTRVVLVRHAHVGLDKTIPVEQWNLSEKGVNAAQHMQSLAAVQTVDTWYTSPEPTAVGTVSALADQGRAKIHVELRELDRSKLGWIDDAGAYVRIVESILRKPISSVHGCESAVDAQNRIVHAIDTLAGLHDGTVGIVSHGFVLTLYVSRLLKLSAPAASIWRAMQFPDIAVAEHQRRTLVHGFGSASERTTMV